MEGIWAVSPQFNERDASAAVEGASVMVLPSTVLSIFAAVTEITPVTTADEMYVGMLFHPHHPLFNLNRQISCQNPLRPSSPKKGRYDVQMMTFGRFRKGGVIAEIERP